MAKGKPQEESATPDDTVRFVALMSRRDRARLKYFCSTRRLNMERIGAQWIVDRLDQEERAEKKSK